MSHTKGASLCMWVAIRHLTYVKWEWELNPAGKNLSSDESRGSAVHGGQQILIFFVFSVSPDCIVPLLKVLQSNFGGEGITRTLKKQLKDRSFLMKYVRNSKNEV